MIARAFKLRFRRRLRLRKKQVEELGVQAERQLDRNFFRRLERLVEVRRFVASWLLLLILLGGCVVTQIRGLSAHYQVLGPAEGGIFTEGILGAYTNANPVYAADPVDLAVSELIFAGLFTYDNDNKLVGDLAEGYTVDERETTYTVTLRSGLTWHDERPLTAADVVFTYGVIQNPDAQSPLFASWQGITVTAVDAHTVTFTLPNTLASFPQSLTTGIIPKHLLGAQPMAGFRSLSFNTTQPVGAGPFKLKAVEVRGDAVENREEHIALEPFEAYHAGTPQLDGLVIRAFRDQKRMVESFKKKEITAIAGQSMVPEELRNDTAIHAYSLPMTAAVMTFLRTGHPILADANMRQALVRATNIPEIIKGLGFATRPVRAPFLQGQVGYNPAYVQAGFDLAGANKFLEDKGWKLGADGIRSKDAKPLTFKLTYQEDKEYERVARLLQKQWRQVGVALELSAENTAEFQSKLSALEYDALLYGISIGVDPDVYAYWDSAQADIRAASRLNFSEYRSKVADTALEAGRTRLDPALRTVKYQPFLQAWQSDAPAVGLYQPRFLYITSQKVYGLEESPINNDTERFRNVHNWMIRQIHTTPTD